jgi:hypothetical protein
MSENPDNNYLSLKFGMENKETPSHPCGCDSDIHTCEIGDKPKTSLEAYCERHPEAPECIVYDV